MICFFTNQDMKCLTIVNLAGTLDDRKLGGVGCGADIHIFVLVIYFKCHSISIYNSHICIPRVS